MMVFFDNDPQLILSPFLFLAEKSFFFLNCSMFYIPLLNYLIYFFYI